MKGVSFVTNDAGEKTAVMLDLAMFGEEVQDFLDVLECNERAGAPSRDAFEAIDEILSRKEAAAR